MNRNRRYNPFTLDISSWPACGEVMPGDAGWQAGWGCLHQDEEKNLAQQNGNRRVEIELWPTAYTFLAGHRIRLQVASAAHPRWNRNLGTGEPPADATKMIVATQTLYHDALSPSVLILPIEESGI